MLFYRYIARKVNFIGLSIKKLEHSLEGIQVAFVQNKEFNKMVLVVEEMNSTQAKLFSGLGLGEFLV